jgi:hypothetical protein
MYQCIHSKEIGWRPRPTIFLQCKTQQRERPSRVTRRTTKHIKQRGLKIFDAAHAINTVCIIKLKACLKTELI